MKICLIGSANRFLDKFREIDEKLTLAGHVVYSIAAVKNIIPGIGEEGKETLDLVHLLKIQESDACFWVTDESKYAGASTQREMQWAIMQDMAVLSDADLDYLLDNIKEGMPEFSKV
jgi:hypothetical protein